MIPKDEHDFSKSVNNTGCLFHLLLNINWFSQEILSRCTIRQHKPMSIRNSGILVCEDLFLVFSHSSVHSCICVIIQCLWKLRGNKLEEKNQGLYYFNKKLSKTLPCLCLRFFQKLTKVTELDIVS